MSGSKRIVVVLLDWAVCHCHSTGGYHLLRGDASPKLSCLTWPWNEWGVLLCRFACGAGYLQQKEQNWRFCCFFLVEAFSCLGNLLVSCVLSGFSSERGIYSLIQYSHSLHLIHFCSAPASWRVHLFARKRCAGLIENYAYLTLLINRMLINVSSTCSESQRPLVTQIL